jgi:hypothetical protein
MASAGVPSGANFTAIGWAYTTAQNVATPGTFQVYFMNTTDATNNLSTTWATAISGMTRVDSSVDNIPASTSFIHTLSKSSAFTYTGGGIYIAFEYSNPSGTVATTANVALCNVTLTNGLKGAQSTSSMPTTVAASSYRPETLLGYYVGSDAQVAGVYTLGLLPLGLGVPHYVQATIYNSGDVDFTSLPCTLSVTGSNTFSNIQTIPSLPVGYYAQVTFAGFSPTVAGSDVLTVTIPADSVAANNSNTAYHTVNNTNTMAYSDGTTNYSTAYGWNTGYTGSFLSKFYVNGKATLNSTRIFTYNGAGNVVSAVAYNKSGTQIAKSSDYTLLAGDALNYVTFTFPSPPTINNDSVYVGLYFIGAASFWPMGVESEGWGREGAFFENTGSGFIDDGGYGDVGILMIEANFTTIPTSVNSDVNVPGTFTLSQNYPNPFNPSTKIDYTLPVDSRVKIELYNITGQKVANLVNKEQSVGYYSINVSANTFKNIASGVYIYKMTAIEKASGRSFVSSKKLMLMK